MRRIYVHQDEAWPQFTWDNNALIDVLSKVRYAQGKLMGQMDALGFNLRGEALLHTLSSEVLKSSEIEGEVLDLEQVRSSIARKLGMEIGGLVESDRNVDGVVDMLLDATQNFNERLDKERLFGWHSALFPSGRSGMYKIDVGKWRVDSTGPMQVVSGALGKEKVHFQAPSSDRIGVEMQLFLNWFNTEHSLDPLIKAGIAHFWFITIHPFEDGNGRMARAITDLLLTRAEQSLYRFYSMSVQIRKTRKEYYQILEKSQQGSLDITAWLLWFLECIYGSVVSSNETIQNILQKHRFWKEAMVFSLNVRQKQMLDLLLGDFYGKLSSSKWAKMMKCSKDTALRDIQDLLRKGLLRQEKEGGRSTNYSLVLPK